MGSFEKLVKFPHGRCFVNKFIIFQSCDEKFEKMFDIFDNLWVIFEKMGNSNISWIHSIYIRTVSSYHLLSILPNQLKLVYGLFGQSNMYATLDFCPRPARKETNVSLPTCLWHQKMKPRIHESTNLKCCKKAREPFKPPFKWCVISYLLL